MPASEARIGYGSKAAISTNNGVAYTDLAEVFEITPPSDSIDVIDVTHMQSPNATREFALGLNDPGECSFEMNFVPGSAADLKIQAVRSGRASVKVRLTFPPGGVGAVTWTFDGILTGYEPAVPSDDKMTATVTFKVTGSYVTGVVA